MSGAATSEEFSQAVEISGYTPVSVHALKTLEGARCELYLHEESSDSLKLYWGADYVGSQRDFQRLVRRGIHLLYVRNCDYKSLFEKIKSNLEPILSQGEIPASERLSLLQMMASDEVEHAFQLIHPEKAIDQSTQVGSHVTSILGAGEVVLNDLFQIMEHDCQIFTHMVNVSSYSVMLAKKLGINDSLELSRIAIGASLHDVGMRLVPKEILHKKGRLTRDERAVVEEHPQTGYLDLCEKEDLHFSQLMMVYQHHERIDGSGYPVQIQGDEIHQYARICAIANNFDALTCDRPYRKAWAINDVLDFLENRAGTKFDKEMVKCWIAVVQHK